MKNIVIFGCQQIAVDIIDFLSNRKDTKISLVITYELPLDKTYSYESVLEHCNNKKIPVINPKTVTQDVIEKIVELNPDIIFSLYYRRILPKEIINLPRMGCINIHPSALPNYRGPVPTAWAIENGEKDFGITLHYMDEGIDTGDILYQEIFEIGEYETGYELYTRAMVLGFDIFKRKYESILNGSLLAIPQSGKGSYYGKKNGKYTIDWQRNLDEILGLIRVHSKPFNPAETLLYNKYLLINKALKFSMDIPLQGPGKIVKVFNDNTFVVSCVDGFLHIVEYEFAPNIEDNEKHIYLNEGVSFVKF